MVKLAFVFKIWLCVWTLVSLLSFALRHVGQELSLLVQTLIISAITVPTILFVIAPALRGPRGAGNQ